MSTHTRTARLENRNSFPRLPSRPGRMLLGGAAIIGGTFAGAWYYMSAKQAYKRAASPANRDRSLPPGEYRISQAVDPVRGSGSGIVADADAGTVEPRASPPAPPNRDPNRSAQHRTLASGDALYSENGAKMQPVPQRDRGDGLAYTKKHSSNSHGSQGSGQKRT